MITPETATGFVVIIGFIVLWSVWFTFPESGDE